MSQSGEVQFRQAEPVDAEAVLEIKQTAIETAGEPYSDEQIAAWRPTEEALSVFTQAMKSEQFVVLLVETDDGPAGYGVLNIDEAHIDAVFVAPGHAGQGLGSSPCASTSTECVAATTPRRGFFPLLPSHCM